MIKRTIVSSMALAGFVALAFGSAGGGSSDIDWDELDAELKALEDGGSGGGNAQACKDLYVAKYNGLDCLPASVQLKPDEICPDTLNISPIDMTSYYECMGNATVCKDGIMDASAIADCKMPTM